MSKIPITATGSLTLAFGKNSFSDVFKLLLVSRGTLVCKTGGFKRSRAQSAIEHKLEEQVPMQGRENKPQVGKTIIYTLLAIRLSAALNHMTKEVTARPA